MAMAMDEILLVSDVDVSKIEFGDVQPMGSSGGKLVPIKYGSKKFGLQTPEMISPFGVNKWDNDGAGPIKYDINLSFGKAESRSPEQAALLDLFTKMDELIPEIALKNSREWFREKHTSLVVVKALYSPMVKYPKDPLTLDRTDKYPPTVKLNISHKDGVITVPVYNIQAEKIPDILALPGKAKGAVIEAIIQFGSIWFAGGKFGCAPRVIQLQVTPKVNMGYAFRNNPNGKLIETDDKDNSSVEGDVTVYMENVTETETKIADSDEEDEDEEEEDDEEVIVTKAPKKPVVKTTKK
jgi:hypothetical protein